MMKNIALLLSVSVLASCGKTGAPAADASPLDAAARRVCMDTIEGRAIKRDSISYIDGAAVPVVHGANGQLEVTLKFSAKNEIGMASTLVARCLVSADGKKLVDINVKEGR